MTESFEDITDQIEEWEWQLDDEDFQATLLEKFESLAAGDPGRAEVLYSIGERRLMRDDPAGALPWFEQAVAEPGQVTIDPRSGVLQCLLELGRSSEAEILERELRRSSALGDFRGAFHEYIGEVLELSGHLREGLRWFNIGVRDLDTADPTITAITCLNGRHRIRRHLDLPLDSLDLYIDEYREYSRAHHR